MCETMNPNVPAGAMGPIKFPSDGNPGSGDLIATPKKPKKKKTYRQKPAHTILSFEEFNATKGKQGIS